MKKTIVICIMVVIAIIAAFQLGIKHEQAINREEQTTVQYTYRWTADDGHHWCSGKGCLTFVDKWHAEWFLENVVDAKEHNTELIIEDASIVNN